MRRLQPKTICGALRGDDARNAPSVIGLFSATVVRIGGSASLAATLGYLTHDRLPAPIAYPAATRSKRLTTGISL